MLSGRGLCDGPILRPEESQRLWCVSESDQVKINNLYTYCEQVGRRGKDCETKQMFCGSSALYCRHFGRKKCLNANRVIVFSHFAKKKDLFIENQTTVLNQRLRYYFLLYCRLRKRRVFFIICTMTPLTAKTVSHIFVALIMYQRSYRL
jgi:hypothetical protein